VRFICDEAGLVADLIRKAASSGDRLEGTFKGRAIVPAKGEETVMNYELTLSVKNRSFAKG